MKKLNTSLQSSVVMIVVSLFVSVSAEENKHEHSDADKTEISRKCSEHK